ncbi:unnamed protein product [Staurois parvus]|uniref:Uncharacterized protein n=1 Tax=Staurois parvus TaxID=386267 RepID=A0ABN9ECH4_9NEOB|nr:unnamed protein product [Staurois parvus]
MQPSGQGRTDNSWGPWAIGDHGAPVSLPTLKPHPKKPIKKVPGASHGAPTDPGHLMGPQMISPPLLLADIGIRLGFKLTTLLLQGILLRSA